MWVRRFSVRSSLCGIEYDWSIVLEALYFKNRRSSSGVVVDVRKSPSKDAGHTWISQLFVSLLYSDMYRLYCSPIRDICYIAPQTRFNSSRDVHSWWHIHYVIASPLRVRNDSCQEQQRIHIPVDEKACWCRLIYVLKWLFRKILEWFDLCVIIEMISPSLSHNSSII